MAPKNSVKNYQENSYYHLYNRGVEKRCIFQDEQDCAVFLSYLKTYLLPKNESELKTIISNPDTNWREKDLANKELRMNNYANEIDLLCYALMPNHFHFLIKQITNSMDIFMNSLGVRYVSYFNKKYKRVGPLFQGVYKAVLVNSEEQLLYLSRYIHLNGKGLKTPLPSSLSEYQQEHHAPWIKADYILNYFSQTNPNFSYANFLNQGADLSFIDKLTLD